jgi:hypothetical protein
MFRFGPLAFTVITRVQNLVGDAKALDTVKNLKSISVTTRLARSKRFSFAAKHKFLRKEDSRQFPPLVLRCRVQHPNPGPGRRLADICDQPNQRIALLVESYSDRLSGEVSSPGDSGHIKTGTRFVVSAGAKRGFPSMTNPTQVVLATVFFLASMAVVPVAGRLAPIFKARMTLPHIIEYAAKNRCEVPVAWTVEIIRANLRQKLEPPMSPCRV